MAYRRSGDLLNATNPDREFLAIHREFPNPILQFGFPGSVMDAYRARAIMRPPMSANESFEQAIDMLAQIASMMPRGASLNNMVTAYRASLSMPNPSPPRHINRTLNDAARQYIQSSTGLSLDVVGVIDSYLPTLTLFAVAFYFLTSDQIDWM